MAITYIPRRRQKIEKKPAIVLCAFGTSTKARVVFGLLDEKVKKEFPDHRVSWAFTSEVIREKVEGFFSLQQTLSNLHAEGYRKAVVQVLHIFPGLEYESVIEICKSFPEVRIAVGEPLLYRWGYVERVLRALEPHFLPPAQGINLLVAHGTDVTSNGANITYLGLDWLVRRRYPNVLVLALDGIPFAKEVLEEAKRYPAERVRFVPFMLVAGEHVMSDIMGESANGKESLKELLERCGKEVDCVTFEVNGELYYKGLGMYEEVQEVFLENLKRALKALEEL